MGKGSGTTRKKGGTPDLLSEKDERALANSDAGIKEFMGFEFETMNIDTALKPQHRKRAKALIEAGELSERPHLNELIAAGFEGKNFSNQFKASASRIGLMFRKGRFEETAGINKIIDGTEESRAKAASLDEVTSGALEAASNAMGQLNKIIDPENKLIDNTMGALGEGLDLVRGRTGGGRGGIVPQIMRTAQEQFGANLSGRGMANSGGAAFGSTIGALEAMQGFGMNQINAAGGVMDTMNSTASNMGSLASGSLNIAFGGDPFSDPGFKTARSDQRFQRELGFHMFSTQQAGLHRARELMNTQNTARRATTEAVINGIFDRGQTPGNASGRQR